MRWRKRGRRGPGDSVEPEAWAELDARLSGTWEAATAAVGEMLDLSAGKEALLASSRLPQENADALQTVAGVTGGDTRRRRRRLSVPLAAGVAALAAVTVALTVTGVPNAGHGGTGGSTVNTAYVVKHVGGALRVAGSGEIAQATYTWVHNDGVTSTGEGWSYGDRWRQVSYSSAGYPVEDRGSSAASVYTQVRYPARTWSRGPVPSASPAVPAVSPAVVPPGARGGCGSTGPVSVVAALRVAVSCVSLAEAGRQRVDGVETIKLTGRFELAGSGMSETVWVSPGTYLPLRVVIRPVSGSSGPSQVADFTWLKPTRQNLAKLTVPIPAGFRQVPPSAMIQRYPVPGAAAASSPAVRRQPVSPAAPG